MQVSKIETPTLAFSFTATAKGNNFDTLSAEVVEAGGSAELINDNTARVVFEGRSYELPIGYTLVLGRDTRLLSAEQFAREYTIVESGDILARLSAVEAELEKRGKGGRSKSEPA